MTDSKNTRYHLSGAPTFSSISLPNWLNVNARNTATSGSNRVKTPATARPAGTNGRGRSSSSVRPQTPPEATARPAGTRGRGRTTTSNSSPSWIPHGVGFNGNIRADASSRGSISNEPTPEEAKRLWDNVATWNVGTSSRAQSTPTSKRARTSSHNTNNTNTNLAKRGRNGVTSVSNAYLDSDVCLVLRNVMQFGGRLDDTETRRLKQIKRTDTVLSHVLHLAEDTDRQIALSMMAFLTEEKKYSVEASWEMVDTVFKEVGVSNAQTKFGSGRRAVYRGVFKRNGKNTVRVGKRITWTPEMERLLALGYVAFGNRPDHIVKYLLPHVTLEQIKDKNYQIKTTKSKRRTGTHTPLRGCDDRSVRSLIYYYGTRVDGAEPPTFMKRIIQVVTELDKMKTAVVRSKSGKSKLARSGERPYSLLATHLRGLNFLKSVSQRQ